MRRRGLLAGVWAVTTAGATLVAWAAVRQVTAEVSPSPALPFPSTVAVATAPMDSPVPSQTDVASPATDPPRPVQTDVAPPAPDAAAFTEAYNLTGGVVTVRYRGATVTLVSAAPNSGFGVEVNDGGPEEVDVRFRADHHESRLDTRMRGGSPDPQIEERPR